jgi:hypothetical protein
MDLTIRLSLQCGERLFSVTVIRVVRISWIILVDLHSKRMKKRESSYHQNRTAPHRSLWRWPKALGRLRRFRAGNGSSSPNTRSGAISDRPPYNNHFNRFLASVTNSTFRLLYLRDFCKISAPPG